MALKLVWRLVNNKLFLNTSQTKSIVKPQPKPQQELCMKGVTIEQVEETELPGVTHWIVSYQGQVLLTKLL